MAGGYALAGAVTHPVAAGSPADPGSTQLSGDQVDNARVMVAATQALGTPQQAGVVAVVTAYQESALLVPANPTVPDGPVSLIWPHRDGLIWPHLRHAGDRL